MEPFAYDTCRQTARHDGIQSFISLRDMVTSSSMEISSTLESPMVTEEELINLIFDYQDDLSYETAPLSCRSYFCRHLSGEYQRTHIH